MQPTGIIINRITLERIKQKSPPSKSLELSKATQRLTSDAECKECTNERGMKSYFKYYCFYFLMCKQPKTPTWSDKSKENFLEVVFQDKIITFLTILSGKLHRNRNPLMRGVERL